MKTLETERLILRQWLESDFGNFVKFFSKKENAQYVGGTKTREEAWRLMATYMGHFQLKGFGYMAIEEKSSGEFVGTAGLWKSDPWPELELGYWVVPEMQGKGYATEASRKVKQYAFETLKVSTLVSYIDPQNEPSKRLAERLGGVHEKNIELLDFGEHCVYRYSN